MQECACCGYPTIHAGCEENCPLCDWYSDAQGDGEAGEVWQGSHPTSLTQARENFRTGRSSHDLNLESEVVEVERHVAPLRDAAIRHFERLALAPPHLEAAALAHELDEELRRIAKVRYELLLALMRLQGD